MKRKTFLLITMALAFLMVFSSVSLAFKSVPVKSIKLNKATIVLLVGKTTTLTASVSPTNATNKTVKWSSSDSKIATVSSKGVVKAVKAGKTTITAKSADGKAIAKCTVTVNSAAGGPIVTTKLTLKFVAAKSPLSPDYNDMQIFKDLEKRTNIHIDWNLIPQQGFNEKKSLILASGDLPDAFFGTGSGGIIDQEAITYGSQGVFIPLEKYIQKDCPNLTSIFNKLPDAKSISTQLDGHIYTLPFIQELSSNTVYTRMFINKTWLDKLHLIIPKTTEQFENVLKVFKKNDMNGNGKNDEIPLSFVYRNNNYGLYGLFGSFGSLDSIYHVALQGNSNDVICTATMPEYKTAIEYFARLYREGLIDPEAFTQSATQYKAKGNASDMCYGAYIDWGGTAVVGTDRFKNNYIPLAPLKGPKGYQLWPVRTPAIWSGYFAITCKNKYPDITMKWVNECYGEKVSMELTYGPIGRNLQQNPDGKIEILDPPAGMTGDTFRYSAAPGIAPCAIQADTYKNKMVLNTSAKNDYNIYQLYAPYTPKKFLPILNLKFTKDQNERMSELNTDIYNYIDNTQAKWITGDSSIDKDWNDYLNQLDKMGLKDWLKIYQEAYNTYLK